MYMLLCKTNMSPNMRFATMWNVQPTKSQIRLRRRVSWSEPLIIIWIFYECRTSGQKSFGVSKPKRRQHRLVWVYACQNTTLLQITCHGSYRSIGPGREKTCLRGFVNNTGADQPAHSRSLISAFVIHYWESIICNVATGEIPIF